MIKIKSKLKNFIGRYIMLPIFGLKKSVKLYFHIKTGFKLDVDNPKYFCEKIQIRKLNPQKIYSLCADKHAVRDYVLNKTDEKYLIKEYFAKEKITVEDLEKLPNQFVLKTNNGCKTNIIVYDKTKEDLKKLVKKMNKYVKIKFGYNSFELFYNDIPPLIIAEELIGNGKEVPNDYKFHCFNQGSGKFIIRIQADHGRFTDHHYRCYFDEQWNVQPYGNDTKSTDYNFKKPDNLSEMLKFAKTLASDFDYVRVDLYSVNNKVYFGELTFTDGSGYEVIEPVEYDLEWGTYWK